jgi:GntR family transcriptional regulator
MLLHLTDRSPEPLHQQISRQVRERILSGDVEANSPLPSIRNFARELKVSVITVQRAYEDLEREELIYARRGKGFFVAEHSKSAKTGFAEDRLKETIRPVINEALSSGLSAKVIRALVDEALKNRGEKG